jgi:outer membrane protein OmpA-like peptidoglycan-associated protein
MPTEPLAPVESVEPAVSQPTTPANIKTLSGSCNLDFEAASSVLLSNFGHNARELSRLEEIFDELQAAEARVVSVTVTGYSSPEARSNINATLASKRAEAFSRYIQTRWNIAPGAIATRGVGEDWSGLRAAVAASDMSNRDAIIEVIDRDIAPDAKESIIRRMSAGVLWRTMERDIFPWLRKVDYTINYSVPE